MHSPIKMAVFWNCLSQKSSPRIGIIRWRYGFADKALRPASKVTQVFEAKRRSPASYPQSRLSKLFAH